MRIGFDAKRLFQNYSGLGNYSRTLVSNLAKYAPEVDIHLFAPRIVQHARTKDFINSDRYHLHHAKKQWKPAWRTFGVRRDIRKANLDVYHGLSHELPLSLAPNDCARVVTVHDLIFRKYPSTYSAASRRIYDSKCKSACERADLIIAISQSTKNDIIKEYGIAEEKINVLYQACDSVFYQSAKPEEIAQVTTKYHLPKEYLIYLGRFEERKNVELILEALSLFKSEERPSIILVGSRNNYTEKMRSIAGKLGILNYVKFIDQLDSLIELRALLTAAKALVYPSKYEGFGLPLAEALLCKTAVIAAKSSSLPEAGGPDTIYIQATDPKALYIAMQELWNDASLADRMAVNGLKYANSMFNPEKQSKRLLELYQSLL